jgi:hypothetical protein
MVKVTTGWIVTTVENMQVIRNRAVSKDISHPVSIVPLAAATDLAIPVAIHSGLPFPTLIRPFYGDVSPEIFGGADLAFEPAIVTTEFSNSANSAIDWFTANLTRFGNSLSDIHKNTSVNWRQGKAQYAIIAIAFNLLQRLLDAPRVFPALRGFSMPNYTKLRSI